MENQLPSPPPLVDLRGSTSTYMSYSFKTSSRSSTVEAESPSSRCSHTRVPSHISVPLSCVPPMTRAVRGDKEMDWNPVICRSLFPLFQLLPPSFENAKPPSEAL